MTVNEVKLEIGIEKPVKILQITDVHLAYLDEQDTEGREDEQFRGDHYFNHSLGYLREAVAYGKKLDYIVFTGDAVDAALHGSLTLFQKETEDIDYIYACGNHEYFPYIFAPETQQSKAKAMKSCEAYFKGDIHFNTHIAGGVNLVTLDNAFDQFTQDQFDKLKLEVAKDYPILLFVHNALFEETVVPASQKRWNGNVGFMDMTEEQVKKYQASPHQIANEVTRKMIDYIGETDSIKAIFAGHQHFNHAGMLPCGKMQYILNGLHDGDVCEIEIV